MSHISSIVFDQHEKPKRATIITKLGLIKVQWHEVCGAQCWFTSGNMEAKKLAITAIERIERMISKQ